jgi:hypothetical protein
VWGMILEITYKGEYCDCGLALSGIFVLNVLWIIDTECCIH